MELTSTQKWVTGYTLHKTDGMWDPFKLRNKYRLVDVTFERLLWVSHFEYLPFVSHSLRLSVPSINMLNESDSKCWISVLKLFSDFKYEAQWNVNASKKNTIISHCAEKKKSLDQMKTRWTCMVMVGREKCGEGEKGLMIQNMPHCLSAHYVQKQQRLSPGEEIR